MIYLDSCLIIYLIEGPELPRHRTATQLAHALAHGVRPCVSDLCRLECRTKPLRHDDGHLLSLFDAFFAQPRVSHATIDTAVFDLATELRASHPALRTPDALHLAAAISAGCSEFWTNDGRLAPIAERHLTVRIPTT